MAIIHKNEDGTTTEEHDFRGTEDAAEAFIAGLKHEAGSEITDVTTEGEAPWLTIHVTYAKPPKSSASEAVEKFCKLGAYPDWDEHRKLRQFALDSLHIETSTGKIDPVQFRRLVNKLMKAELERGAYERGGAGI